MERWGLVIHSGGRTEYVQVYDEGVHRDAWFSNEIDAFECARVIQRLRQDSAFEGVDVYRIE